MPSRRQVLAGLGAATGVALAGCTTGEADGTSASDLTEKWRTSVGPATAQAAVSGESVFVPVHSDVLALSRETGERQWSVNGAIGTNEQLGYNTTPAVDDYALYVAGGDRTVRSISLDAQSVRWAFEMDRGSLAGPVLAGSRLYVAGGEYVYCLDSDTGEAEWSRRLFGDVSGFACERELLVATTVSGEVYALDTTDGSGEWRASVPERIETAPVVSHGRVAVAGWKKSVFGFDRVGQRAWSTEVGLVDAMTTSGDTIYANTGSEAAALDWDGGETRWTVNLGMSYRNGTSSPSPADGAVYVGGDILHAIDTGDSGLLPLQFDRIQFEKSLGGRVGHVTTGPTGSMLYAAVERNPGSYEYVALEGA
jgi:outer membrane protein assembly factor BamB